jgi:hypothetical protein
MDVRYNSGSDESVEVPHNSMVLQDYAMLLGSIAAGMTALEYANM